MGEFFSFSALTFAERTPKCVFQSVECKSQNVGAAFDAMAHAYTSVDGMNVVVVASHAYPMRVAYSLIQKVLEEIGKDIPKKVMATTTTAYRSKHCDELFEKYKDPSNADKILKVQKELDETKIVVHNTIESVLRRGEKLETLVERSEQLSGMSKIFYKDAKKANACCSYLA